MRIFITVAIILGLSQICSAQQKWNLQTIVDYAMANNINVRLSTVQEKIAAINYKQSKLSLYPNANFNTNSAVNAGNNQDPVTFNRINQTYLSAGFQLQSSADIFNFYSKRNTIIANNYENQAAMAATDKIKNDIALSAANAYLQILLSREQENITLLQIQQTTSQLGITRKQVNAGALPELNATQLEAQLALDSVNYITAKGNTTQAILLLKANLNIDAAAPFEVDTPPIDKIPVESIASLQPDYVFDLAIKNLPQQRFNDLKLLAAQKNVDAAKGRMLPSLSAFGSIGTSYIAARTPAFAPIFTGFQPNGQVVNVSGTSYFVNAPTFSLAQNGFNKTGNFTGQVNDNLQKSLGLSISVPLFSGGSLRSNYERSKLNINTIQLQKEQDNQKLKQDIYQAYNAAVIALEKFNASKKSIDINELNLNFATKRFNVGMLGTFDLITTQNNLLRAKLEYAQNKFDYVFKRKVLEFYKGMGLKL
ncbi:MAG: TolC family protein [Ferruginibacter sp.]|nr:TolC family protein [Ferruginibacter sp.]